MASFEETRRKMITKFGDDEEKERLLNGDKKKDSSSPTTGPYSAPQKSTSSSSASKFSATRKKMNMMFNPADRVDDSYINKFVSDAKSFLGSYESDYKKVGVGTASDLYSSKQKTANDLRYRGSAIKQYLDNNKDTVGAEYYDSLMDYLDNVDKASGQITQSFYSADKHYSRFDTQEEYDFWEARNTPEKRKQLYQDNTELIEELEDFYDEADVVEAWYNGYKMNPEAWDQQTVNRNMAIYNRLKSEYGSTKELAAEIERLKADNLNYERGNYNDMGQFYGTKVVDDYYSNLEMPDFDVRSQNRDYSNPTKEEIAKADAMNDSSTWYFDANGVYRDAFGNELAVDKTNTWYNPAAQQTQVEDKLALYLGTSEDERVQAGMDNQGRDGMWSSIMKEGYGGAWEYLNKNELGIYYYLLDESQDTAYKYLADMETELNRRRTLDDIGQWHEAYDDASFLEKIALNVATFPAKFGSTIVGSIDNAVHTMQGEDINPYSLAHSGMHYSQTVRGDTAKELDATGIKIPVLDFTLGDIYQTGMSRIDSALATSIFGGGGTVFLGMGAAQEEAYRLYQQGASAEQITLGAFSAGAAEAVFEYVSFDKLVKMGDADTIWKVIKNALIQGGVEASEETFTEVANIVTNAVIMGQQSDLAKLHEENGGDWFKTGLSLVQQVAHSAFGGLIGGTGAGITQARVSYANTQAQYRDDGRTIMKVDGGVDALKNLANQVAGVSEGKVKNSLTKQAGKVTDKDSRRNAKNVGKLYSMVQDANNQNNASANQQDIAKSLERKGFNSETANDIASALVASYNGQTLTNAQEKLLESVKDSKVVQDAVANIIDNTASTMGQRSKNIRSFQNEISRGVITKAISETIRKNTTEKQFSPAGEYEVSDSGKAINTETGEDIDIKGVSAISNGKLVLELADGSTIDANKVSFASGNEALLYEAISNLGDSISAENANKLIAKYDGSDAKVFASGISLAYTYGFYGIDRTEMTGKHSLATELTREQRNYAYGLGEQYRSVKDQNDKANARATKAPGEKGVYYRDKDGNATDIRSYLKKDGRVLNEMQTTGIEFMEKMSKMMGVRFNVFESWEENGTRYYLDENGEKTKGAPNGFYDTRTGEIYIDLFAGNDFQGTMLFTVAHELTHFMRQWSPEHFTKLAKVVFSHAGFKGDVASLVADKMARAKANGKPISYDTALEEVVADGMETILKDGKVAEFMADVKKTDIKAWAKLKAWFKNFAEFLKKMVDAYSGQSAQTVEGQKVADFSQELLNQIEQIWAEGAVEAGENYQTALENVIEENAEAVSSDEIITDGAVVTDGQGTKFSIKSMKHDIADGQMFEDLKTHCGFTQEQVNELRNNLENLVEYMTPRRDILDMNESYGREGRRFSPYKPNSDPLYKISMDFSTLCSKRLLTQYVIENLQLRENRPMSAEEQMAIRDMLNEYRKVEKGLQVACAMCYVEAARLKSPKQIQRWLDDPAPLLRDYFGKKNKEFNDSVKEAQADFKESRGYARNAPKKDMKQSDVNELNKIGPKMRAKYQLSAEEQAIIDKAKTLPNSTYLTAGNLSDLSESDPVIYDAYTAFVRTATRSKGLETDEPYYYGDSRRDNGNGIVVSDSFIEAVNRENGMRFSSWSDWRIQHLLDYITAVIDNSVRGAAMHGYTKFGDEVRVLGKTGMMFNMSGVTGTQTGLNEDGSLNFSETESINVDEAIQLREEFPEHAGLQCIGVSDAHIIALLASDIIDYVIPYHVSGLNAALRRMADIYGWDDYTGTQNASIDKSIKKEDAADPEHWHEEPIFSEFFVGYDTGMSGIEAMRASAERYKQMCKDRGLTPKFNQFANEANYWKLLIDRKMINQQTGDLIRQKAVTPTFDFDVIKGVVSRYVDNYDSGLEARALNHIVENWDSIPKRIKDLKKQGGTKAKKTKKAVDTLANQTLAAQPTAKMSERKTFKNGQNDKGEFFANILIDLADMDSEWWTGGYNHAILSMSKSDDTEFRQFYQEILKRTKDMEEYGEADNQIVNDAFIVQDGKGNKFIYRVALDGYLHGVVVSKINLARYKSYVKKYGRSNNHGRTPANTIRRVGSARSKLGRNGSGGSGSQQSNGNTGSSGVVSISPQGNIAGNDSRGESSDHEVPTVTDSNPASKFATYMKGMVEVTGGWYAKDVFQYVEDHPALNFIERIFEKDKTVKKDLANFLDGINDTKVLDSLSWFMGEAWGDKGRTWTWEDGASYPYRGAVRTFRNAIKKRINTILTEQVGGTNLGIKNGEVTLDEIKDLFGRLNSNEEIGQFAEKVFATAEKLGVNIRFVNKTLSSQNVAGDNLGDMVEYKTSYFNDTTYTDQRKASTILHELIHACTVYVMRENTTMGDVSWNRSENYNRIANAATRLNRIYFEIMYDTDFQGQYGIKSATEMVAELANEEFVGLLKKKNLWDQIVDWICDLFGIRRGSSAYDNARLCLDYILDNPEVSEYKAYAREQRRNAGYKGMDTFGQTLYSDRVLMGSLFSGGGTIEAGLVYQMLDKEFAVEYNRQIAATYTDNHGKEHMFVGDVRDFNSKDKQNVFYLHASPVCKNFSPASHGGGETTLDIVTAQATARVLEEQMPQVFTVENVKRYIGSEAYNLITDKLTELGYQWDVDVYKASDYGNATKRERMVIRAVKDGDLPAKPVKESGITSWGEATRDLWDTDLIPSTLVKSKIEAIRNTPQLKNLKLTKLDKPLMIYDTSKSKQAIYAWADELAPTLTTKCGDARIIMPDGRVYEPTPKFMGRIQGLPDDYKYPKAKTNAFKIIGNGIPTQLTKAVIGGVLDSAYEQTHDGKILYSERTDDSVSNRYLLANAFESLATDQIEAQAIAEYKSIIPLLDKEEQLIRSLNEQIKELSFAKGPKDTKAIRGLQFEARQSANRINTYDRQLLRMEASKPLQDVLAREKKLAYERAEKKGKEALEAYREKTMQTQRELLDRWQKSRKKAVEGRHQTAMRHKIKAVVNELNQYLLRGTKDRHVPIELQKAVAEALDAVNMDTVGAEERIAKLEAELLKAKTPEKIQEISRKIDHIREMGDKMNGRLKKLKDAYDEFVNSDDPLIANSHDEVISNKLQSVIESVGDTPLRDMSLSQLEDVYDMYRMVLTTIRNANKAFKAKKSESISVIANRVMMEVEKVGGKKKLAMKGMDGVKSFVWNNLKPVYAFEHIGSDSFTEVFNAVRAGEDVWAVDVTEAREFYLEKAKKHNYDSWDFKQRFTFKSASGMDFSLDLEQIMSLYAYSKRDQAADHLRKGGIVIDETTEITMKTKLGIPVKFNPTEATAYNISDVTLADIIHTLSAEQKSFVDEMQDYLSTVMGAKGNEVSLEMYGVKLFKEKFYFPLKSAQQFMAKAKEQQKGEVKIKNSGFSKETVQKASNPIVLTPFMNVWADHVNEMSMYHAFVLPMEDFYRVYNYKTPTSETMATESVEMFIQNAYGKGATKYIDQLLKDLNGGARTDHTTGIINKMMGLFKKGAVFASLSVVVQQPSAIARAAALVDTKYFIGPKVDHKRHKALWDEVKKYAPVAVIKEMGYFDTNMGKSTQDFIMAKEHDGWLDLIKRLDVKGLGKNTKDFIIDSDYRDEVLSWAPGYADELAWCSIWEAVKRETKAKNPGVDVKSEAFLKMVGERFTEVIVKTQVYDSVLSRSGLMRSKDTGMKMATAFMAEPTTSINMIADALLQGKRGNRKYARATIGAVIASQILNSILVSFVYAGRDDDEDETYLEKYIGTLTGEVLDSLNPAGYIPFIKDIMSIVQGYDVERSDMAVISDLWNAWENLSKDNVSVYRKVEGFAGSIAQIFGLPVKNIMRDVRGIYQTIMSFVNGQQTTKAGIGNAVKGAITGKTESNQQQLYDAILSGDQTQIARVKGRFKDQSAIDSAIRKALRENDSRIREAAVAWNSNDLDEYMRLAKAIIAEKHFSQDNVVMAIRAEANALEPDAETTSSSKAKGLFTAEKFAEAIAQGDEATANAAKIDIIDTAEKNGKTKSEAEKSFASSAKTALKELYLAGELSRDKAISALTTYCDIDSDDAVADIQYWDFKQDYPDVFADDAWIDEYYNEVESSGISLKVFVEYRNKVKSITGENKKVGRMAVINSLPITNAQKDALYFAEGWAASTLHEAPWH